MKTRALPLLLAFASLLVSACNRTGGEADVTFARSTFESLARGEETVADEIDWKMLHSMGVNAGREYVLLESDQQRSQFREVFITQFASSFQNAGGNTDDFTNWRIQSHDDTRTVVAADGPSGVLTLTVSERDGERRLSRIDLTR